MKVAKVPKNTSMIPNPLNSRLEIKQPIVTAIIAQSNSTAKRHNNSDSLNWIGPKLIGAKIRHKTTYIAATIDI